MNTSIELTHRNEVASDAQMNAAALSELRSTLSDSEDSRLMSGLSTIAQKGMTLLEIMIVLTILALVMAFVIGPRVLAQFSDSRVKLTELMVRQAADQAYTEWSINNTGESCPKDISELQKYTNSPKKELKDSWGSPLIMLCGDSAPDGSVIGIQSIGADMKKGTKDDIKSWE